MAIQRVRELNLDGYAIVGYAADALYISDRR